MFVAYLRTYARMGLKAIPMRADSGAIGGDLSHEFIILADTGESAVYCHRDWLGLDLLNEQAADDAGRAALVDRLTGLYAATDEKHDPKACPVPTDQLVTARGIEVGHIFYFGTKYSKPLGAVVAGPNGESVPLEMGSYGIGVSRLVGAIIEASHDDAGIIWPEPVAPFDIALVNLKRGDKACDTACENLYAGLTKAGREVLYDDRDERAGVKLADMDLIGIPHQIIVGPRGAATGNAELKARRGGAKQDMTFDAVLNRLAG
jgi:prolyl-tRNA synthetase